MATTDWEKTAATVFAKAKNLVNITLPVGSEHHYLASTSQRYQDTLQNLQEQAQVLLGACQGAICPAGRAQMGAQPVWTEADEVQDWVTGLIDDALTSVDTALDKHHRGVPMLAAQETIPSTAAHAPNNKNKSKGVVMDAKLSVRPQSLFNPPVDNSTTPFTHWAPHLTTVTNHQPPQAQQPQLPTDQQQHPLHHELENLTYLPWQLEAPEPIPPRPLEETPLHWVDTPEALQAMVLQLQACQHVAIDLENHSFRSYQGFLCLMQVSSRTEDWVVDTLALRSHLGPALQPLFANPAIVKVLHGADHDVLWLQRDLHLYLVNMFDTGQAARVLSMGHGLAHLLQHFCKVTADKRYQMADWRVRPLAPELMAYARSDTHYLLYIHDRLKQLLVEAGETVPPSLAVPLPSHLVPGALSTVLERSRHLCLTLYEKEALDDSGESLMNRRQVALAPPQVPVLRALLRWRDQVCREEDEGTGYVLPNAQLLNLAKQMPESAKDVLRVAGNNASEVLRRHAGAVAAAITTAKTAPAQPTQLPPATTAAAQPAAAVAAAPLAELVPVPVARIQRKQPGLLGSRPAPAAASQPPAAPAGSQQSPEAAALPAAGQPAQPAAADGSQAQQSSTTAAAAAPAVAASTIQPRPRASAFAATLRKAATVSPTTQADLAKVRSSFTLPFLTTQPPAQTNQQPTAGVGSDIPIATGPSDQPSDSNRLQQTTAADVRSVVEALRAAPQGDVVLGADGQSVEGAQASGGATQEGDEDMGDEEGEEAAKAQEEEGEEEEAAGVPAGHHRGEDVGIEQLEFVPMSMAEIKKQKKAMQAASVIEAPAVDGQWKITQRKNKGDKYKSGEVAPRNQQKQYQTGLGTDQVAGLGEKRSKKREGSLFGSSDEGGSGSGSESEDEAPVEVRAVGKPVLKKRKVDEGGAGGRGGRGRDKRGGRGGAAGGRGGRGGGRGGRDKPAFNPYDIPEENLIKGGKRSAVMPRSGNRTATFR